MTTKQIFTLGLAALALAAPPAFSALIPHKFQEVAYPGDTFTQLLGINTAGTIAGYHGMDVNKGFTLTLPSAFTSENYPNSAQTQVIGINTAGDTAGFYVDANGVVSGFTVIKGTFATANAPGTNFNQILGLNNVGELAGYSSLDPAGETMQRAFVRQSNGSYVYLPQPTGTGNSQATGINDAHTVVGFYVDANDNNHGFIVVGGVQSTLDFPGSIFTQALGINNAGQVVGQYQDVTGGTHGFLYTNGAFQSVDEPAGKPGTTLVNGINDLGQIVGFFEDAQGNTVGFVGTAEAASETTIFRAVLAPAAGVQATGTTDIIAHVVRDGTGKITSGTVDFLTRANFPNTVTALGLNIQNGPGPNAPAAISSGIGAANMRMVKAGGDIIKLPAEIKGDVPASLTALGNLLQNPGQYYVSLSTTDFPAGALTGKLQQAQWVILMGMMDPNNEVPAATNSTATGVAQAVAIGTRDATGNWTSGEVYLTTTYTNQRDMSPFTGFHIHLGAAGVAGPVAIPSTMPTGITPNANGSGVVGPYQTEIALTNAQEVTAFTDLFTNPGATYMNIHNMTYPGGFMRAQLRATDSMWFPLLLDSANEVMRPTVQSTSPGSVGFYTLRNQDGTVAAATVFFDLNYRLPAAANITMLDIHDAAAGANGMATIPIIPTTADPAFSTTTGFGNFFDWTPPVSNLTSVNDVVKNPENHYVDIHTSADAAGAVRAQLAPAVTMPGTITGAVGADLDANATTAAPGELISIFGGNFSKVATSLGGWTGTTLPASLNGVTVTVGGQPAPLIYVGPNQINAQVPLNTASGKQPVVVMGGAGASDAFDLTVAPTAPAIFFSPVAAILKAKDYSLVSDANPAHVGDVLLVYWTGGGQTTPPLNTGALVPVGTLANTAPATCTIGGQNAAVLYSVASPQFTGLYQTAVTVPAGVNGSAMLMLQVGGTNSNAVNITVQ